MRPLLAALPLLAASLRLEGGPSVLESFTDAEDLPEEEEYSVQEEEGGFSFAALRAQGNQTLRETAFKNVLLVVHCRLKSDHFYHNDGGSTASRVCFRRQKLFAPYAEFFPEVVYWTNDDCAPHPTNPHNCLPQLLKERAQGRDGVFYIHFDALIKPLVMARDFDLKSIAVFKNQHHCKIDGNRSLVHCHWGPWIHQTDAFFKLLPDLEKAGIHVDRESIWYGMDDVFYLPSAIFKRYGELVPFWSLPGIHHELAGPMMWRMISAELGVKVVSLGCTGGCCKEVFGKQALAKDFRCGHPFRLNDPDSLGPWQRAMIMS